MTKFTKENLIKSGRRPFSWDEAFEEAAKEAASSYTPELAARTKTKSEAEFQKGIRLGWWDAKGNSLLPETDEDDNNEDEQEADQ